VLESPRTIAARVGPLLLLCGAILAGWIVLESAVFRSGLYFRYAADPESTAGATNRMLMVVRSQYREGMRNVLVMGDSRANAGFAMAQANAAGGDINFIGGGIAGTTPRVWYHVLRELDPHGDRFAAVVFLGIADDAWPNLERLSDRNLDLLYLQPVVDIEDLGPLPASFIDPDMQDRARRAVLLPGLTAREDLRAFAAAPRERLKSVRSNLHAYVPSFVAFPGHTGTLANMALNPNTLMPVGPRANDALGGYLTLLSALRNAPRPLSAENAAYYRLWYWRIAEHYRGKHTATGAPTRLFLMALPRGPFHAQFGTPPSPSLTSVGLDAQIGVELLAPPAVYALERPGYYFDGLHLNATGRERYTPIVADTVRAALGAPAATPQATAP
jgi:hypothetical protein